MNRTKFIVDVNVGKLAVWLRALGYDTVFVNPVDDSDLIELALRESRIVLTKDTGIMKRHLVTSGQLKALLIVGKDWKQWLAQVVHALHLKGDSRFTRCVRCNVPLETRAREDVPAQVPTVIYRSQELFFHCPSCLRYYWQGSHWRRMSKVIDEIGA